MGLSKVLILFSLLSVALASLNSVPAIVWTNNNYHAFERLPLGRTIQNNDFFAQVKDSLDNPEQSVLLFLKDKLSLEDLAHPGTYSNVKSLSANQNSAHYSSIVPVGDSFSTVLGLPVNHIRELEDFSPNNHQLSIVHLPNNEDSDSIVSSIISKLNGAPYTAVFTGLETSELPEDNEALFGRHLLSEDEEENINATFLNSSCLLLYTQKINLQVRDSGNNVISLYELPLLINMNYDNECEQNDSAITLKYKDEDLPSGLTSFSLRMEFKHEESTWKMIKSVLSFKEKNETANEVKGLHIFNNFLGAPKDFCYHCALPINVTSSKTSVFEINDNNVNASVIFVGLQVQPSTVAMFKFGRPNDCVGFFTIPIWSGLLVGILLLSVLSFGICMMASMHSIDRFDDPRAKTITVALGD